MALSLSPRALGRGIGSSARKIPGSVVLSVVVLVAVAICVIVPSVLVPGALDQNLALGVSPAGTPGHLLGTDKVGRDVLALTVAGARSAIVVAGVIGGSYWVTVGVLIVLFAPSDIRMIRAATLAQKPQPYIEATRVLGLSGPRILAVHILPNITPIVWANLFVNIAFALVSLSGLSYLGLGVGAQDADWGRQLADGRALLAQNPAASVAAGLAIIVTATAINIAGDWFAERKERDL